MWKRIQLFHCAGKHLLTAITAVPILFFNEFQLRGVLEYCNVFRIGPQGRNTKPYFLVPPNTFFLPTKAVCLLFPPSSAFVGTFSWPGISSYFPLTFQIPLLPDFTLEFLFFFCICPYLGRVSSQCAQPLGILCCFLGLHKPPSWREAVYGTWREAKCMGSRVRNPERLHVCDLGLCLHFSGPSVFPLVKWRLISFTPVTQICGQNWGCWSGLKCTL